MSTIIYSRDGRKERIGLKEYVNLTNDEQEKIYEFEVDYEFSEEETDQIMKTIFTSEKYKKVSGLIMWTGMIKEEKFIKYFKKYIVSTNVSIGYIERLANSKHNPIGILGYQVPRQFKFKE